MIHDRRVGAVLEALLRSDARQADEITPERCRTRSARGRLRENLVRPVAPLR